MLTSNELSDHDVYSLQPLGNSTKLEQKVYTRPYEPMYSIYFNKTGPIHYYPMHTPTK